MKRLHDAIAGLPGAAVVMLLLLVLPIAIPIAGLLCAWFFHSIVLFSSIMPWPTGWAPLQ